MILTEKSNTAGIHFTECCTRSWLADDFAFILNIQRKNTQETKFWQRARSQGDLSANTAPLLAKSMPMDAIEK